MLLKKLAIFCLAAMLSACTTAKLEELRQISPQGSAFNVALAREYLAFSNSEAEQYDWVDSYHFADKGLKAAYNHTVKPEISTDWNIEDQYIKELQDARLKLMKKLSDPSLLESKAQTAARAQYFYDCWVEQQEEAWQTEDIAECKQGFLSSMEALEEETVVPLTRCTAYMVFFDHNQWDLTPEGHQVLGRIVEDLLKTPDTPVLLHGHTDASGTDEYNMELSQKRALAVKNALVAEGIEESRVSYFAFGETDLRVQTADGIREPANRRVEIFLE
jgi:OOP family OmpA-OmpF porin